MQRQAEIERNTLETRIRVSLNLDGTGESRLDTGMPFLEHMLDQVARHGLIDLEINAEGDLHIDGTTQPKILALRSDRRLPGQWVIKRAFVVMATPMSRWTRR